MSKLERLRKDQVDPRILSVDDLVSIVVAGELGQYWSRAVNELARRARKYDHVLDMASNIMQD